MCHSHNQVSTAKDLHTTVGRMSCSASSSYRTRPPPAKWHFLHLESTYTQAKQPPVLQTHPRSELVSQHRCLQATTELDRQGLQRHYLKQRQVLHSQHLCGWHRVPTNTWRGWDCIGRFDTDKNCQKNLSTNRYSQ